MMFLNERIKLRALVDTGADFCLLSLPQNIIEELVYKGIIDLQTYNHIVISSNVKVHSILNAGCLSILEIGDLTLRNVYTDIIYNDYATNELILGYNVLKDFDYFINNNQYRFY